MLYSIRSFIPVWTTTTALAFILSTSIPNTILAASFERGLEAFQNGNKERALEEWRPLAEDGHAEAQHAIGNAYEYGHGTTADDREAIKWYRKAAEQNIADAQYRLGVLHDNGWGTPRDAVQAVFWYRRAAQLGHTFAQHDLAFMYLNGTGVPMDHVQAYKWLRIASVARPDLMIKHLMHVSKNMTFEDIEKAEDAANAWLNAKKI